MESHMCLSFVLVIVMSFVCSSQAHFNFYVGGRDGWVLKPSEIYNHWAERSRFQVNDFLIFKYKKGSDSVLVVNKDDYYKCNKAKPIQSLEDGDSVFKFDRSGPFFFISGHGDNCEKGQKFIIIVLAVRNNTHKSPSPTPSPSPSPALKTPTSSLSPSPASVSPNAESPKAEPSMSMVPEHRPVDAPAPAPVASAALGGSEGYLLGFSCVILGCFFGLM